MKIDNYIKEEIIIGKDTLCITGILICIFVIWYVILSSEGLYNISSIDRLLFPVSLLCGAVGVYVFSSRFISLLSKIYEVEKT